MITGSTEQTDYIMPPRKGRVASAVVSVLTTSASSITYDEILLVYPSGSFEWVDPSSVPTGWIIKGNSASVCERWYPRRGRQVQGKPLKPLQRKDQSRTAMRVSTFSSVDEPSTKKRKFSEDFDLFSAASFKRLKAFIDADIQSIRQKYDPDGTLTPARLDQMIIEQQEKVYLQQERVRLAELGLLSTTCTTDMVQSPIGTTNILAEVSDTSTLVTPSTFLFWELRCFFRFTDIISSYYLRQCRIFLYLHRRQHQFPPCPLIPFQLLPLNPLISPLRIQIISLSVLV